MAQIRRRDGAAVAADYLTEILCSTPTRPPKKCGGIVISEMLNVAAECARHPLRDSVYSPRLNRFICADTEEGRRVEDDHLLAARLQPPFKLVFLTVAIGTLVFAGLCVGAALAAGRETSPLFEEIIRALMWFVQLGVGTILGLLGARAFSRGAPLPESG